MDLYMEIGIVTPVRRMLLPGPGASRCGETGKTAILNGNYADTLSAGTYRDLEGAGLKKRDPQNKV